MRSLLGLAAASIAVAAAHGDDRGIPRDARLDRSLAELLAYPVDGAAFDAVDAAIQQTLALCRARGVSGIVHSASAPRGDGSASADRDREDDHAAEDLPPSDVEFCHRVRFVRHARQRHRASEAALRQLTLDMAVDQATDEPLEQDETPQEPADHAIPVVTTVDVRRADELDYQTFFESYAERSAPVVWTQPSTIIALGFHGRGGDDVTSFLSACFPSSDRGEVAMQITRDECVPWLDQFQVPLLTVNNFIPRTELSMEPTFLPTMLTVSEASSDTLPAHKVTCPFGFHSVFLPIEGAVEYQLHDARFMPFAPPHDHGKPSQDYAEVSVSVDATLTGEGATGGRYADLVGATFSDSLDEGHALFVPGGRLVATLRGASRVLRFCFFDASNLNHVTETLRIDALVSSIARKLFLVVQAPTFDASMARRPSPADTLWGNYVMWPKEAKKLLKLRDMVSSESEHVPMSRRERLKLWQDDKRWERRIKSLTLPVPLAPVVMNATRNSVTLRWQDLYERPRNDITAYGYEVRWRREDVVEEVPKAASDGTEGDAADDAQSDDEGKIVYHGAVNFTHAQLVRSAMPTTLFGDEFDGKDIEGVVRGLAAEATYSFTVRIYVGDNVGVESERSRSAQTAACSAPERVPGVVAADNSSGTCVDVRWLAPTDDGGRRITSYVFALKYLDDSRLSALQGVSHSERLGEQERFSVLHMPQTLSTSATKEKRVAPAWLSGSVCDQIPGRVQVRVAAVNAIGVSAWSKVSVPMEMGKDTPLAVPTVRGRGDPAFLASPDNLLHALDHQSERPRVILSDVLQQVVVVAPNASSESRLDVWAGHFSPQRFHVSSELVLADPLDASRPLRNAADVRDRVAVVLRGGGVPFLYKVRHAQRAGALGVVFVDDARDRCARGFDQSCVPGAMKRHGEGFGASDHHPLWREARIPFVLAQREPSEALLQLLRP